ncbi:MAG TPA: hypothetical protein VK757_07140 [Candidatus Acidoferrum sp.]|jgi:hypothetical protein|nr:hypothetical protein [Candidatus Acidoferrum sp.]
MRHARTTRTLGLLLLVASAAYGTTLVPDSSIFPARLETSISSKNAKVGELIRARIMQAVPLLGDATTPAGSILTGKVTAVQVATGGEGGSLAFRLDTLHVAHENVLLTLRLRAIASDQEVRQAQLPRNSDPTASSNSWTTVQIGGDVVYRGGGPVRSRSGVVGKPVEGGVLVRLDSNPARGCRNDGTGERAQALWLFSSDACGTYGLPDVTIVPADHNAPADATGEITLKSAKGNLVLRSGSGLLLRVVNPGFPGP